MENYEKFNFLSQYDKKEEYIPLWDLAKKFCLNSTVCDEFSGYIVSNFLKALYLDDQGQKQSVFAYRRLKNGVVRYYFKKAAFSEFKKRFSVFLKEKAREFEKEAKWVDLRTFSRMMSKKTLQSDKQLRQFIIDNCLNDKAVIWDEQGQKKEIFLFKKVSDRYVYILKKLIPFFAKKYEVELKKIGFSSLNTDINNSKKVSKNEAYMPLSSFISYLGISKHKLKIFKEFMICCFESEKKNKNTNDKTSFFHETSSCLYIRKDQIPAFINEWKKSLLKFSLDADYLDHLTGKCCYPKRSSEMISVQAFLRFLRVGAYAQLRNCFVDRYLKDVEKELVEVNGKSMPVFVKAIFNSKVHYFFKNDQMMRLFIKKNKEALLNELGVPPAHLNFIVTGEKLPFFGKNDILVSELPKILHKKKISIKENWEQLKDETYPVYDEEGNILERKMFKKVTLENYGRLLVVIERDALKYFALRHQDEFQISSLVVDDLWGKSDSSYQPKEWWGMQKFCLIMGKNPTSQLDSFNRRFIDKVYALIEQKYQNATFDCVLPSGDKQKRPLFKTSLTHSRRKIWQIHSAGLIDFVKLAENDLLALGFKKEKLIFSDDILKEKVTVYHQKLKGFYLTQKQKRMNVGKQYE